MADKIKNVGGSAPNLHLLSGGAANKKKGNDNSHGTMSPSGNKIIELPNLLPDKLKVVPRKDSRINKPKMLASAKNIL